MCRFNLLQANTITGLLFQEGGVRVMTAQRTAPLTHPYGAHEIKLLYNHNLSYGLSSGIGLLLAFTVVFFIYTQFRTIPIGPKIPDVGITFDKIPLPTLYTPRPSVVRTGPSTITRNGVPVPVPDPQANPGEILSDQKTLSQTSTNALDGLGDGTIVVELPPDNLFEPEPDMNRFYAVEIEPEVVRFVIPDYPEIARRSGIEGKVFVRALVDKTGKVRKTAIMSTNNEVFNQSALDAAGQYVFAPGMMNNGPVQVWVTLQFVYRLR